jgi:hypothetical protein
MTKRRPWLIAVTALALGLLAGYEIKVLAEGAPTKQPLFYAGTLEDNGAAANGDYTLTLSFYDAIADGKELCATAGQVSVRDGHFRFDASDCADALHKNADVWLEVSFKGSAGNERKINGRTKIGAVPYALEAQHAISASSSAGALATELQALTNRVAQLESASASKSAFQAIKRSAQSIPGGDNGAMVIFDDEQFDYGNEFDPATSTFTARNGGVYEFSCSVTWTLDRLGTVAEWEVNIFLNGDERAYNGLYTDGEGTTRQVQLVVKLNAGDRVQCGALQDSSTAQALNVSGNYITFEGRRFAP